MWPGRAEPWRSREAATFGNGPLVVLFAITAVTRRSMTSSLGKTPTTSVRQVGEPDDVMGHPHTAPLTPLRIHHAHLKVGPTPVDADECRATRCSLTPLIVGPFCARHPHGRPSRTLIQVLEARRPLADQGPPPPGETCCRWIFRVTLPRSSPGGGGDQRDDPADVMSTDNLCERRRRST